VLDFLTPDEDDSTPDVTGHVMPAPADTRAPASVLGPPLRH